MSDSTFKLSALATGVAVALGSTPQASAQEDQIEEITVTGSHIRRTEYEGRAPIQIVDAAAIELIGAAQPVEVLKDLTVNSGSDFYNETNARAGVSQFNIRNLGLGSTLTLINGKRGGIAAVANQNGTDFVDINQFPLAMIERIEVLTDGASATYGSQAVAGVANIITRKGFEGLEVSGGYSTSEVDLDAWHVNLAAGSSFDRGAFNIYATFYEQDHLERSEFDWMQDRLIGQGDISRSRFLSSTGSPGSYRRATLNADGEAADVRIPDPMDPTATLRAGNNADPDCVAAGGVLLNPADIGGVDNTCRYHFVDQVSVISAETRAQVFAEFDWEFNEDIRFYNESSFSNNQVRRDSGGSTLNTGRAEGGGVTILPTHPFNFFIEDPADPLGLIWIGPTAWDDNIHTAATLRNIGRPLGAEVNNNAFTGQIKRDLDYTRILNGFEFALPGDWYLDVSYMYAKSQFVSDGPHNYRSGEYQDLVRSGQWNPFGTRIADPNLITPKQACTAPGQLNCTERPGEDAFNDPTTQSIFDERAVSRARAVEQVVDVVASGELFEIGNNPVGVAVGGQFRESEIRVVDDTLSSAGLANEQGLEASIRGRQDVVAFFAEAVVPIADIAEIQLAVRNEDYGAGVTTTDPKFSFNLAPTDWVQFRGSFGTSFQAPTVRQTAEASSSAFLDDPASPTGAGGATVCTNTGLNNNVTVTVRGAPDLQPQESENFAIGTVFTFDRFRASIDYWNFDYTDLISQQEAPQAIVDAQCPNGDTGLPINADPRVIRDAGGQLRQVITQFINVGSVETDGIDVAADYTFDVGNSTFIIDTAWTFVNSFDVDSDGDGTQDFDGAGSRNFRNSFSTMPEIRGNIGGTWLMGNHSANLTYRYIDSYKNDQSNNAEVDDWPTIDAQYSYTFNGLIGDGDTVLTIGANNLLDEDPPALARANADGSPVTRFNTDGTYNRGWIDRPGYDDRAGHDLRGRIVYFRFKQSF